VTTRSEPFTRNTLLSIAVFVVGLALLFWGFQASNSFASEVSEAVEGTPSNMAIGLMVVGTLLAIVGVLGFLRRS